MQTADISSLLLLLINVLAPVPEGRLAEQAKRVTAQTEPTSSDEDITKALHGLRSKKWILDSELGIGVTDSGMRKIERLGLRSARDKNRLFFLKYQLKTGYNPPR